VRTFYNTDIFQDTQQSISSDFQERVYNVHEDKQATSPEVVSLIPTAVTTNKCGDTTTPERIATPPPTPPQRLDSISLKAG